MSLYRFNIESHLPVGKAAQQIEAMLGSKTSLTTFFSRAPEHTTPFVGKLEGQGFSCTRRIRYQNSFLPHIKGWIESVPGGSRVSVRMNLHLFVWLFLPVFLGVGGYALITTAAAVQGTSGVITEIGAMAAFLVVAGLLFYLEAFKARKLLEKALQQSG